MQAKTIEMPVEYIASLGGLHDVRIDEVAFNADAQTLTLDTSVHFDDDPELEQLRSRFLVFAGVSELCVDVDLNEGLRISEVSVAAIATEFRLEISLNIGGGEVSRGWRSITAKFKSVAVR
jgi:hypothetical protein